MLSPNLENGYIEMILYFTSFHKAAKNGYKILLKEETETTF